MVKRTIRWLKVPRWLRIRYDRLVLILDAWAPPEASVICFHILHHGATRGTPQLFGPRDSWALPVTILAEICTGQVGHAMRPDQRILPRLPLTELWDARGVLPMERRQAVGHECVADSLRSGRGDLLRWILPTTATASAKKR